MGSTASGRIGVARDAGDLKGSQSAPTLKGQLDRMGGSGAFGSQVIGSMAKTMGARISDTLHHRGEHECGAIVDPNDEHVYVPRAQWTQSHDHPLKANNAQWNKQHFVAEELKRLHGDAKRKEYIKREVDRQLQERSDTRSRLLNEKEEYAQLVRDDVRRHNQDQDKINAANTKARDMMVSSLGDQRAEMGRRAHETRVREAQEAAEVKMRTVQQMCEELAEANRKKQQLQRDLQQGMKDNEAKAAQAKEDKKNADEKMRQEIREALMQDEYRQQAKDNSIAEKQAQQDARISSFDRTAGVAMRAREHAELTRIDNDEKRHLMRTDAYYAQRERARERQRHNMVLELDRQMAACNQKAQNARRAKQAEREQVQAASKRSLDQEMAKAAAKRAEEQELQQELRIMMLEKEERNQKEGNNVPTTMATMHSSMRKNGNACNAISDLHKSLDAARHLGKPMGREDKPGHGTVPLDVSGHTLRRLEKSFKSEIPISSVLGGVVGTLGGGGGQIQCGLMATGGPFLPKSVGLAVQDRKLDSAWYEGIRPEVLEAGRQQARRREAAKAEANRDY